MPQDAKFYLIGEVARLTGLRASAIRYYESVGLLPAPERSSGQRRYLSEVFKHIRLIQTAQRAGFSIAEIKTLLDGADTGETYSDRLRSLSRRKLAEVEKLIADAQSMKRILEAGLECRCAGIEDCLLFVME